MSATVHRRTERDDRGRLVATSSSHQRHDPLYRLTLVVRALDFRHGPKTCTDGNSTRAISPSPSSVQGPLILDDLDLVIRAAIDGAGLAFMAEAEDRATQDIARAALGTRARGLVRTVSWFLPLLSQPPAAASSAKRQRVRRGDAEPPHPHTTSRTGRWTLGSVRVVASLPEQRCTRSRAEAGNR